MQSEQKQLLEKADRVLSGVTPLLDTISWPRAVEEEFFARKAAALPRPSYEVDRERAERRLIELEALEAELGGDDALSRLLRLRIESQRLGSRMLLAVGTSAFGELSALAFGGARSTWLDHDTTNLEFANHLAERIEHAPDAAAEERPAALDAHQFKAFIEQRLAARSPRPKLEILVDAELSVKVTAGKRRLRIREGATFSAEEARSLYHHEVETHVFTAQNGDHQALHFLDSGGPLTTRTQEGLAVFSEMYSKALTIERLRRLIERVRLVAKAEQGADFIELYRYLLEREVEPRAAFMDVARIFRGGIVSGGSVFTKDACYLAGFAEVYNVLRLGIRARDRSFPEVLVCGRLALEELPALLSLREDGLVVAPKFVPTWLRAWEDLVLHFAFSSFLQEIDLDSISRRYPWLTPNKAAHT